MSISLDYISDVPSEELLLVCGSLAEIGFDLEAENFRKAIFDRSALPLALKGLVDCVLTQGHGGFASETVFRLYQRLASI